MSEKVQRESTATCPPAASQHDRQHPELAGLPVKHPAAPLVRDEDAAGSNPATPTMKLQVAALFRDKFRLPIRAALVEDRHFYTISDAERDYATNNLGYVSECEACYVYPAPTGTVPLYRVAYTDHFYTTLLSERDQAIAIYGTSQRTSPATFSHHPWERTDLPGWGAVELAAPPAEEAVELQPPPGVPVVRVLRTVFDSDDLPVEVQDSVGCG